MKRIILFCTLIPKLLPAQDTLVLKNNTRILSLVLLVTPDSIKYKRLDNVMGPDYFIRDSEVKSINYKNGKKENIDSLYNTTALKNNSENPQKMYKKGMDHAELFYKHNGGSIPIGLASVIATPVSFIPVWVLMAKPPATKNLGYPSEDLWNNEDYKRGYLEKATGIRRKKMVKSFVAGSIVSHFLVAVIISLNWSANH